MHQLRKTKERTRRTSKMNIEQFVRMIEGAETVIAYPFFSAITENDPLGEGNGIYTESDVDSAIVKYFNALTDREKSVVLRSFRGGVLSYMYPNAVNQIARAQGVVVRKDYSETEHAAALRMFLHIAEKRGATRGLDMWYTDPPAREYYLALAEVALQGVA